MKKGIQFIAIAIICTAITGCKQSTCNNAANSNENNPTESKSLNLEESIGKFLTDSIGSHYSPGEVCIPVVTITDADSTDMSDIKAWGDFWVFNYDVSGDTLKTVSGGSHPGMFHLIKNVDGYQVTAFDGVEDGSRYMPSAKRIFGDRYDAFRAINGDEAKREELRRAAIEAYVKANGMSVTMYQDFGWPAHAIKQQ